MSDQNESDDDTPLSSWCGESKNSLDDKDTRSDGADDKDWDHIDDMTFSETRGAEVNEQDDNFQSPNFREESSPPGLQHECALAAARSQSDLALPTQGDEEVEYEVRQVLEARIFGRKLKYRVKWLGYDDDPKWYDAV
ncbi:hypothetical protein PSPO01_15933 [Paraphaeosphaeria sporulosa]